MEHIRRFCVKKCMWTCAKLTEVHFFGKVIRWTPGFFVSCFLLSWVLSEFLFLTGVEGPLHWLPLHALRFPCCFLAVFTKLNSKVISTQVIDCPMRSMNANWTCSAVITSKCKKSSQDRRVSVCYLFSFRLQIQSIFIWFQFCSVFATGSELDASKDIDAKMVNGIFFVRDSITRTPIKPLFFLSVRTECLKKKSFHS